ncbi:hypothetical protein OQX61_11795 [Pedobacter sp. PLR]|uniref:hypothetical protein n=1 Tax=Pedobacter sp. PLR TaxID=2994465 RepID=UPI0022484EC6|nr:hypothetical protein [Pedobacter sp. PLR]MCX2451945.1 hypothetical protein [Pedobacter sp. PLR]
MKKERKMKLVYLLAIILAFSSCKKEIHVTPVVEQELMVSTFVGSGSFGFRDGIGEATGFKRPTSMVIDASGNIFVADKGNFRIRKVTPNGVVSTFVGDGIGGYLDGTGTAAKIGGGDNAITIDAQNNLYLADPANLCIRKITPAGVVSTLVGAPGRSNVDGPIATAGVKFISQADIAIDASNNIYFNDIKGIRKVSADGIVSTIVQVGPKTITGPIATAVIASPINLCTDKTGNIYVASLGLNDMLVIKISTDQMVSYYAGKINGSPISYSLGLAESAQFNGIRGMIADKSGNVLIVDQNHIVTKITPDGWVRLVAGIQYAESYRPFVPGPVFTTTFADNIDVAVDPNGIIYVLDCSLGSIRKISLVDKPTNPPTQTEIEKANWNKATTWK